MLILKNALFDALDDVGFVDRFALAVLKKESLFP